MVLCIKGVGDLPDSKELILESAPGNGQIQQHHQALLHQQLEQTMEPNEETVDVIEMNK